MTPESVPPSPPGVRVDASHAQGVVVGDGAVVYNTYNNAAAAPVDWPVWVGTMPGLADCWQSRDAEQAAMADTDGESIVVLTQVLSGMGGVGKSQLAAAHAQHAWADHQP